MKKYVSPEVEVIRFGKEDVIRTSASVSEEDPFLPDKPWDFPFDNVFTDNFTDS